MSVVVVIGLPIARFFAWAFELTPEGIKCEADVDRSQSIAPRTCRKSECFQVSFLQHENCHLADYRHFPNLHAVDLEYRAKLTELVFASSTLPRLPQKFNANGSADLASPHAQANYWVVRDVYQVLFGVEMPEAGNPWECVRADRVIPFVRSPMDEISIRLEANTAPIIDVAIPNASPLAVP